MDRGLNGERYTILTCVKVVIFEVIAMEFNSVAWKRETELKSKHNKWGLESTSRVKVPVDGQLLTGDIKGREILTKLNCWDSC